MYPLAIPQQIYQMEALGAIQWNSLYDVQIGVGAKEGSHQWALKKIKKSKQIHQEWPIQQLGTFFLKEGIQ